MCAADKFCRSSDAPGDGIGSTAFAPSNFDASLVTSGTAMLRPAVSIRIDTDSGAITTLDGQPYAVDGLAVTRIAQPGAPELAVVSLARLDIAAGVTVRIDGRAALAFAVRDGVSIAGTIDASAAGVTPGPGGFAGVTAEHTDGLGVGAGRACPSHTAMCGGGGAGNVAAGGTGGAADGTAATGAGGTASASGTPLIGGASGATGNDNDVARSGAGGGAVQITTFGSAAITTSGVIDVGGGAGDGGSDLGGGGSGGGAGGLVVIEADQLAIGGTLAANGGGGGGGSCGGMAGAPGQTARSDAAPAAGGVAADPVSSAGGAGGAGDSAAGASAKTAACAGGGGGGAGGRLRLRARRSTVTSARALSPAAGVIGEELL